MAQVDIKSVPRNELGIMGGALVAFIGLFFHAYGGSASGGGFHFSAHVSGWHFVGLWLPTLLLVAAAALVGVRRFRGELIPATLPIGTRVIVAGVALVALLWVVIRALTYPGGGSGSFGGAHYSYGASFGTYLVCIATAVAAAFAVLDFRESGEALPAMPKSTSKPADPAA